MLLHLRVRNCSDDAEYELLRQEWDAVNRPRHQRRQWSPRQEEALGAVAYTAPGRRRAEARAQALPRRIWRAWLQQIGGAAGGGCSQSQNKMMQLRDAMPKQARDSRKTGPRTRAPSAHCRRDGTMPRR